MRVYRKRLSVEEFRKLACSKKMQNPKPLLDLIELERHYWKTISFGKPIYGADTTGSLYDEDVKDFNLNK